MASKAPFDRLETIKKVADFSKRINSFVDKKIDTMENRWGKVSAKYFDELSKSILKTLTKLDTRGGAIENSQQNIATVQALKAEMDRVIQAINIKGKEFMAQFGQENLEEITRKTENFWAEEMPETKNFLVINPAVIREIVGKSILVWNDTTGNLAQEINRNLLNMVLSGTTMEKAIDEYAKVVPAIEKPKRGGGMYRLSAEARAQFTMSTEFIRMFSDAADKQAQEAWGEKYYVENLNPMDDRTAPECVAATEAGPMQRDDFVAIHGMPPRHPNCRCSVTSLPEFLVKKE